MAKTIGSLNVSMGLSITDFITNLDKVKDDMGSLEAVTSEASKHFDEDVAGVMGDALHKFAKTSKLGADDALAFAVSLKKLGLDADTITSTLDKFGKGIGKFAKNAGEASKAFAGILGKIGESDKVLLKDIQALESMGVKAFDMMAKELTKVEGKAVSTAEVMKRIASGSLSGADALKALTSGLTAVAAKIIVVDTNTAEYIANSKTLKGTTDLATKSLELQARQMMVDSGATKQLFEDMKKLETQELAVIALENKAKGIVAPVKVDTNTAAFVNEQINLKSKTDLAAKALEMQARQMNIDSGATKQLYEDMKKLETQELKLIEAENRARGIPPPLPIMPPPLPVAKIIAPKIEDKAKESQAKSKLAAFLNHVESKISSAASSIFSRVTNLIMNPVTAIGGALASYGVYKIYDRAVMAFANTEEILTRIKGLAGEANAERLGGVMGEIANQGRIAQDVVGKLATGFLGLGVSGKDAATMIESFGRTSLVAGSGATDVFNKLGEVAQNMVRTGVASKEDFATLASMGLPVYEALAQRLTTVMGRAIGAQEAMQMLARNQVGTGDALNALAGMQNNADVIKQAEAQAGTLKGIYARLAGEVEGFFTEFGADIVDALDLKGFSQGLIGFMQSLRANFDSLTPAIKNIGMVLAVVRDVLFDAFKGLVSFFTTMGGADVAVGNIDNIREVVVSFAQSVMVSMQSVMSGAITVINEIISAVGGLKKFAAIFAGVVAGAKVGTLAGSLGGVTALPAAIIGGVAGGLYANSKVSGGGPQIDAEAIKTKMNASFDVITKRIGGSGGEAGNQFLMELENTIVERSKGFADKANPFRKFSLAGVDTQIDSFFSSLTAANVGHTTFLNTLQGGVGSTIAILRREMELGNLTAEEFAAKMTKLSEGAMASLDAKLKAGIITNNEYANGIALINEKIDALDISGLNAFMGGDQMPAWIRELSNIESPLEIYRRKMEELQMTLADRPDLFAAGAAQLADELERSVGAMEELKNPAALMQGSAAAFSQVLKIQNANGGESASDRLLRLQQRAEEKDTARNNYLAAIAAASANQAQMNIFQV